MSALFDFDDILKCGYCNCILEIPVTLPCNEIICEKHINEIKFENDSKLALKCKSCNDDHEIPNFGFRIDKRIEKLLNRKLHQINFGEIHSKAIESSKALVKIIDQLKHLTHEPEIFITEYFNNIKNQVNSHKEKAISTIERHHKNLIETIQNYMETCSKDVKQNLVTQKDIIEETQKQLGLWQSKLAIPDLSKTEFSFEKIEKNITSSIKKLNRTIETLKNDLLLGKTYEFINEEFISQEKFGQIMVQNKVIQIIDVIGICLQIETN